MRIIVCGGRHYDDWAFFLARMDAVTTGPNNVIIQGNALGADAMARKFAALRGFACVAFKPDWVTYGRAAGPIRNQRMLDEGKPDLVVAFDGHAGTFDMCRRARIAGIRVQVETNQQNHG